MIKTRVKKMYMIWFLLVLLTAPVCYGQNEEKADPDSLMEKINLDTIEVIINGDIHMPDEILRIMGRSDILYIISAWPDTVDIQTERIVLSNQLYYSKENEKSVLYEYELSEQANSIADSAWLFFDEKNYNTALELYKELFNLDTTYYYGLTLIGDCFYVLAEYDSALYYFDKAIEKNFIDYNAHWFKADTFKRLNRMDEAMREITIAHLLNINHESLFNVVKSYREKVNRPWKDWSFDPSYLIKQSGDSVIIKASGEWLGYAMVKAVWKYEPGYARRMIGEDYQENFICSSLEEKEAVIAMMVGNNLEEMFNDLIKNDMFDKFVMYEFFAKKYPTSILPSDSNNRAFFENIVDYVNLYH